ncbi:MAG: DUF2834 domain-containing protein [Caulobacter sp.]|nr:DUF2834 domain-containing protein [Caulobacter sp.]
MPRRSILLCVFYALIASVALVATWSQNMAYFRGAADLADVLDAFVRFALDTRANAASRSITVDLALFTLAGSAFMIIEARRLGISWVWAYILLGFLVAISVTFPLFMIARERHICWWDAHVEGEGAPMPTQDRLGIALVLAVVLGLSGIVLAR